MKDTMKYVEINKKTFEEAARDYLKGLKAYCSFENFLEHNDFHGLTEDEEKNMLEVFRNLRRGRECWIKLVYKYKYGRDISYEEFVKEYEESFNEFLRD